MTSAGVECDRRNRGGADDDEGYGRQRNEIMVGTKDQEGSFWPLSGTRGDISSRRERQAHCNDPYDRTPRHDADATSKKCALFCSRMRWTAVATVLVSYSSAHKSAFQRPLRLWRPTWFPAAVCVPFLLVALVPFPTVGFLSRIHDWQTDANCRCSKPVRGSRKSAAAAVDPRFSSHRRTRVATGQAREKNAGVLLYSNMAFLQRFRSDMPNESAQRLTPRGHAQGPIIMICNATSKIKESYR
ncbi:uncharacterized protein UHOD_11188 [Ustilago sp. UG-2017b]|nr:uncharacterized protein UHOD_11188 [Ustilago sp. UG-2017b]